MFRFRSYRFPDLVDEMHRMHRLFGRSWEPSAVTRGYPSINVHDDGEAYLVRVKIPGIKTEELEIEATARSLSIKGERKPVSRDGARYRRRERELGSFARTIELPQPVDPDSIAATYEDGILEVTLPKAAEARPRKVAIA